MCSVDFQKHTVVYGQAVKGNKSKFGPLVRSVRTMFVLKVRTWDFAEVRAFLSGDFNSHFNETKQALWQWSQIEFEPHRVKER